MTRAIGEFIFAVGFLTLLAAIIAAPVALVFLALRFFVGLL